MKKFCTISGHLLLGFVVCFIAQYAQAQNDKESSVQENNAQEVPINEPVTLDLINDFDALLSAEEVVTQLRSKYGVQGSILLTNTLWKILTSYSNQQQAENIWQAAVASLSTNKEVKTDPHVSIVNAQFNAGRVLTQHTHGMTIMKWNNDRQLARIDKQNIVELLTLTDDLTVYFRLSEVWQILLSDITKQQEINWKQVFLDSLQLFSASVEQDTDVEPKQEAEQEQPNFFDLLKRWPVKADKNELLADMAAFIETQVAFDPYFYQTIVRFILDKSNQHYLAASHSWFAVAEQLYFYKDDFDQQDFDDVMAFVEENDAWFLAKEQQLLAVNEQLPEWVESSFHQLKMYFNGAEQISKVRLMSAYQMVNGDLDKYMNTPFRRKIHKDFEICLNISEEFAPYPQQPIDNKQFTGCITDMMVAATREARIRELSGSLTKIDSQQALDRALQLPAWQIINILYANSAQNNCLKESHQLVNPLEWTLAAESLLWFADRWPAYMRNYPQQAKIGQMIEQGQKLIAQHPCLEKTEQQLLTAQFTQMVQSWQNVKAQIRQLIVEFNQTNLTQGSDINLLGNVEKQSNYRVENVSIMECDAQHSCGVHIELESSRALFGLFPNHLLVADQLKLGALKLCYDNVGWEQRRSAPTHLNNDSVANYFGYFSFSLKGFYGEELVFERKLVDEQEYLYLFAENSEEVSNVHCPLPIVGKKIATNLKEGTYGLVPNRLTFLTASRANESEILGLNWSKGQEWRDKIITDEVEVLHTNELSGLSSDINQAYQAKAAELQNLIYQSLLDRRANPTEVQKQLTEAFNSMQRSKALFLSLNYFLQTDDLMTNDGLHGLLFGQDKIPDAQTIDEFYQNQTNINVLISSIDDNMIRNKEKWNKSQNWLSHPHISNLLFRLKSISP